MISTPNQVAEDISRMNSLGTNVRGNMHSTTFGWSKWCVFLVQKVDIWCHA